MKYTLVSTYPREGTQNIGDKLIEQSTEAAIREHDPDAEIEIIWRADDWENVRDSIADCDHVIFACLAIRAKMERVYPFLEKVLDQGVPVSAVAAGTSLAPASKDILNQGFSDDDIALLRRFSDTALVFTTRGLLTQYFCRCHGLHRAEMSGDIAFFDPRFEDRRFNAPERINRIAISDPHFATAFEPTLRRFISVLRDVSPDSEIDCLLHGVNPEVAELCNELDVRIRSIYQDPLSGLDIYDEYDLHAGFRVHGHVSALNRRIPSYLFEQDGRGADYGVTFTRKLSVSCYRAPIATAQRGSTLKERDDGRGAQRFTTPVGTAELIGAMISDDVRSGFHRFDGFEEEIREFNTRTSAAIRRICSRDLGVAQS